jgi:16S rRNA (guanine527-N7)-methyltransferase
VDSLAFSRHLTAGEDVLDVGTGGGVPGVVLAILRPDISISLCESVGKKARAVESMLAELGLDVAVHAAPVQQLFEEGHTFDTLVIRAVARLEKLLKWFNPFWGLFHRLLVLKGPNWPDERRVCREQRLIQHLDLRKVEEYAIPGTGAQSVLLELTPKQEA